MALAVAHIGDQDGLLAEAEDERKDRGAAADPFEHGSESTLGLEWGGDWKGFKDMPYFQYTGGLTLAECRDLARNGLPPPWARGAIARETVTRLIATAPS